MENTNNNLERCRVIRDPKELNSEGCRFFIEANTSQMTMMTSTKLRWLTHPVLPKLPFGSREKGICNSHPIVVETCQGASLLFLCISLRHPWQMRPVGLRSRGCRRSRPTVTRSCVFQTQGCRAVTLWQTPKTIAKFVTFADKSIRAKIHARVYFLQAVQAFRQNCEIPYTFH